MKMVRDNCTRSARSAKKRENLKSGEPLSVEDFVNSEPFSKSCTECDNFKSKICLRSENSVGTKVPNKTRRKKIAPKKLDAEKINPKPNPKDFEVSSNKTGTTNSESNFKETEVPSTANATDSQSVTTDENDSIIILPASPASSVTSVSSHASNVTACFENFQENEDEFTESVKKRIRLCSISSCGSDCTIEASVASSDPASYKSINANGPETVLRSAPQSLENYKIPKKLHNHCAQENVDNTGGTTLISTDFISQVIRMNKEDLKKVFQETLDESTNKQIKNLQDLVTVQQQAIAAANTTAVEAGAKADTNTVRIGSLEEGSLQLERELLKQYIKVGRHGLNWEQLKDKDIRRDRIYYMLTTPLEMTEAEINGPFFILTTDVFFPKEIVPGKELPAIIVKFAAPGAMDFLMYEVEFASKFRDWNRSSKKPEGGPDFCIWPVRPKPDQDRVDWLSIVMKNFKSRTGEKLKMTERFELQRINVQDAKKIPYKDVPNHFAEFLPQDPQPYPELPPPSGGYRVRRVREFKGTFRGGPMRGNGRSGFQGKSRGNYRGSSGRNNGGVRGGSRGQGRSRGVARGTGASPAQGGPQSNYGRGWSYQRAGDYNSKGERYGPRSQRWNGESSNRYEQNGQNYGQNNSPINRSFRGENNYMDA